MTLAFRTQCRNMLINLKGQVRSSLDRDGIPNWPQTQRNICSPCVTQSCPLGAPDGPQEPGNSSKSRAASTAQMLTGHSNGLSQFLRRHVKLVNEIFIFLRRKLQLQYVHLNFFLISRKCLTKTK